MNPRAPSIPVEALHRLLHEPKGTPLPADQAQALRAAGCELAPVDAAEGLHRLVRSGLGAWEDYLAWRCPLPGSRPRTIRVFNRTSSTQDVARALAIAPGDHADGALVIADEQTHGRGRLGRRWTAPPGAGLLFTRVRLDGASTGGGPAGDAPLTLAASVACAEAIDGLLPPGAGPVRIKWPNDLTVGGRKLAGLLVESTPLGAGGSARAWLLGVGLNTGLRQEDLPADAGELASRVTSLSMLGADVDRLRVLAELVRAIDAAAARPAAELCEAWRSRATLPPSRCTVWHDGAELRGEVIDIDPLAGLIFRRESGEILHLPAATTTIMPQSP